MIKEAAEKAARRVDLTESEMRAVFEEIMSGKASTEIIAAFLASLASKGETVDEITGAAKVMREKCVRIHAGRGVVDIDEDGPSEEIEALVDTCGTGGSGINTFNISTTAAFVIAGCGLKVAKHGNRSASSHCGSADVLEALGVKLDVPPEKVRQCIRSIGIGFLYAPLFHNAMKHAAEARKMVGRRTIFNILGPLSNPAGATSQVVGVYDPGLTAVMAGVLRNLGIIHAFVVHGMDNLDEITVTAKTKVSELKNGKIRTYYIAPEKFGVRRASLDDIKGGSPRENADITMSVLKGERSPRRDIVLMNACAGLMSGGRAKNFRDGMKMAANSINSGSALDKLINLIEMTNS